MLQHFCIQLCIVHKKVKNTRLESVVFSSLTNVYQRDTITPFQKLLEFVVFAMNLRRQSEKRRKEL